MNEEGDIPSVPEAVHCSTTESHNEELASNTGNPQQEVADEKSVGPTFFQRFGSFIGRMMSTGQDTTESMESLTITTVHSTTTESLNEKLAPKTDNSQEEVADERSIDGPTLFQRAEFIIGRMECLTIQVSKLTKKLEECESEKEIMKKQSNALVACKFYDKLRNQELKKSRAAANRYKKELAAAKSRILEMENEIKSQSTEIEFLKTEDGANWKGPVTGGVSGMTSSMEESLLSQPSSFSGVLGNSTAPKHNKDRSNLLSDIRAGPKLRRVEPREAGAKTESEEGMNFAAILTRMFANVNVNEDDDDQEEDENDDWSSSSEDENNKEDDKEEDKKMKEDKEENKKMKEDTNDDNDD